MAGYWRAWEAIRGADVILSGLECCANPVWQTVKGPKGEGAGNSGALEHMKRGTRGGGKFRLRHNDMYGNLCCDQLILLFFIEEDAIQGVGGQTARAPKLVEKICDPNLSLDSYYRSDFSRLSQRLELVRILVLL